MVDYVSYIGSRANQKSFEDDLVNIYNYAIFLKQPLTLSMFVPTDENGNVLEETEYFKLYGCCLQFDNSKFEGFFDDIDDFKQWEYECLKYQQAKERVLFEGFKVVERPFVHGKKHYFITNGNIDVSYNYNGIFEFDNYFKNIESLVPHNLTLTETAVKKLGL